MRTPTPSVIVATILCIWGVACVGTDVGNPGEEDAEVEMHMDGYDSSDDAQALKLAEDVTVESAWIVVEEFRFQEASACGDRSEADYAEELVVDLLADEPSYEPPVLTVPSGEYCGLDVGLAAAGTDELPQEAPEALDGHGLVVEGQRADRVDFRIEVPLEDDVTLEGLDEAFELDEERQSLIVGFAIDQWIDEQDLNALGPPDGDTLVIDETTHPEVVEELRAALPESAGLFEDPNENGQLEDDERGSAVARGAVDRGENRSGGDAGGDAGGD